MDLASAWELAVLLNRDDGSFENPRYEVGRQPRSIAAADLDGDGGADLAIANEESDSVSLLFNEGDASFGEHVELAAGSEPVSIAAADLDGDDSPDLAVAYADNWPRGALGPVGGLLLFFNEGPGSFSEPVDVTVPGAPVVVKAADLDGDGEMDLAVGCEVEVAVLLNQSEGAFAESEPPRRDGRQQDPGPCSGGSER